MTVASGLTDCPGADAAATAVVAPAELAATAVMATPLARTAELASATITRVRMNFMTANPSGAPAAREPETHALERGCRQCNFNGHKKVGQRGLLPFLQAASLPRVVLSERRAPLRTHRSFPDTQRSAADHLHTGAGP